MDLSCFNLNDTTGYVATLELGIGRRTRGGRITGSGRLSDDIVEHGDR